MVVVNEIECEESFKKDGNTKYTPVIKIVGTEAKFSCDKGDVSIQIDRSKKVKVDGYKLLKAIHNALNV